MSTPAPPPPPPPPAPPGPGMFSGGTPLPPPAPPIPPPLIPGGKSPQNNGNNSMGSEPVRRLPQQSIPAPKARMRTVNWNKIPMGQIFNNDKNNLWVNFANNYKTSASTLDWEALEGMFCIQTEKAGTSPHLLGASKNNSFADRTHSKRESNEVCLSGQFFDCLHVN